MAHSRSVNVRRHSVYVVNDWKQLFCEYLCCFHLRVYQLRLDICVVYPECFCPHDSACPCMFTLCLAYFFAGICTLSTALGFTIPGFSHSYAREDVANFGCTIFVGPACVGVKSEQCVLACGIVYCMSFLSPPCCVVAGSLEHFPWPLRRLSKPRLHFRGASTFGFLFRVCAYS